MNTLYRAYPVVIVSSFAMLLAACHSGPPDSSTLNASAVATAASSQTPVSGSFERISHDEFAHAEQVGDCNVDTVNGLVASSGAPLDHRGTGEFAGWVGDRASKQVPPTFKLVLTGAQDFAAQGTTGVARPDVASATGVPAFATAGYQMNASVAGVPVGKYGITVVYSVQGKQMACATKVQVTVE